MIECYSKAEYRDLKDKYESMEQSKQVVADVLAAVREALEVPDGDSILTHIKNMKADLKYNERFTETLQKALGTEPGESIILAVENLALKNKSSGLQRLFAAVGTDDVEEAIRKVNQLHKKVNLIKQAYWVE
jgi:ATP phosphoribosyltransferase regulatory subunit HisZ